MLTQGKGGGGHWGHFTYLKLLVPFKEICIYILTRLCSLFLKPPCFSRGKLTNIKHCTKPWGRNPHGYVLLTYITSCLTGCILDDVNSDLWKYCLVLSTIHSVKIMTHYLGFDKKGEHSKSVNYHFIDIHKEQDQYEFYFALVPLRSRIISCSSSLSFSGSLFSTFQSKSIFCKFIFINKFKNC